jgi:hypothetical protein
LKDLQAKIKSISAKELQQQQDTCKFVFHSIILTTLLKITGVVRKRNADMLAADEEDTISNARQGKRKTRPVILDDDEEDLNDALGGASARHGEVDDDTEDDRDEGECDEDIAFSFTDLDFTQFSSS